MTSYLPGTAPTQPTPSYAPQGTGMSGIQPRAKPNPAHLPPQIGPQQSFPGLQPGGMPPYMQGMPGLQGGGPPSQQYPQQSSLYQQYMQQPPQQPATANPAMQPQITPYQQTTPPAPMQQPQFGQQLQPPQGYNQLGSDAMQQYQQMLQAQQGQQPPQQLATINPAVQPHPAMPLSQGPGAAQQVRPEPPRMQAMRNMQRMGMTNRGRFG